MARIRSTNHLAFFDECLEQYIVGHYSGERGQYDCIAQEYCGSPIEARMLAALYFMSCPIYFDRFTRPQVVLSPADEMIETSKKYDELVLVVPQASIGEYRADFLIIVKLHERTEPLLIVVECDGHDFHERTKEQAAKDRRRDREMQAAGFKVFRFTGSEIFRDTIGCVTEISRFMKAEEERTRPE